MDFLHKLRPYHLDVLKEIGNIGAAHAATALSELLNKQIDMSVPDVRLVSFQDLPEQVGGADTEVAAIFLRVEGEAPGSMFFISKIEDMEQLVRHLTKNKSFQLKQPPYDELGLSAFQEVGNILAGSYLSSFSDFTKLMLQPSVPGFSVDMTGAILSYGLIPLSEVGDYAIVIDTEIRELNREKAHVSGHFFYLPDPDSFEVIFAALGVETNE
ncbi:chemotaxis protein CheC [Halalkalibacter nanhaiisediminis]|uniref:Chemotaxis protein CheC n=1 Tax=Halalkalibacter nanhaiisediminis TaxID=688079 RepID=A0A562QG70_9BACI|nr:chemotaxis protein CheC [Halalkalibacter nanhaiisediminis]TWI55180.1 chemotaxis protein CheC [Halalkalibacter nanhaiisediminis]